MKTNPTHPSRIGRPLIWSSLWGGGTAWLLHLLAVWVLAEFGCMSEWAEPGPLDISRVAWGVLAVSLLCLLLGGLATWTSWRCGRGPETTETRSFVFRYGLIANPLFMLIIAVQTVPVFYYLKDCGTHIIR